MLSLADVDQFSEINGLLSSERPCIVSFLEKKLKFDYFFFPKNSDTLLVLFPSALPKNKRNLPAFHRWSWCENFTRMDCISVSDPTLFLDDKILGGWMQGLTDVWALEETLKHIKLMIKARGYKKIIFTGSSLGGFCAIQAGCIFDKGEEQVFFYAENPQISLYRYWIESHMNLLARVSYGKSSLKEVVDYKFRLDIVQLLNDRDIVAEKGLIVVKESDDHHFNVQLNYLIENLNSKKINIETIPLNVDSTGHTPLNFDDMWKRISSF